MRKWILRALCLLTALCMSACALAEGETSVDTHFVPENPDQMPAAAVEISLDSRVPYSTEPLGERTEAGVRYTGLTVRKAVYPLPQEVIKGDTVTVTLSGVLASAHDDGLTVSLTDDVFGKCSAGAEIARTDDQPFTATVTLKATKPARYLAIGGALSSRAFEDFTLTGLTVEIVTMGGAGLLSYEAAAGQDWYQTLLTGAQMHLGSNLRLKNVIARAQAGEDITIATIGGSITEGAGAARYTECYAYQIYAGFRERWGAGDGSNVHFINAGVGGTPSPFGWMRYQREIVDRVDDADGLPDLVVIEYAVNDGGEPTNHRCYESMIREILDQPNHPAVILMFSVFPTGYTLQADLSPAGFAADLMMISMRNSAYPFIGDKWSEKEFFYDQYHPTTLGHRVMADCALRAMEDSAALPDSEADAGVKPPVFGTDFMGLHRIFRENADAEPTLTLGGFKADDAQAYKNLPVGRVCGANFHHPATGGSEPLTFTATFRNLMIAYRTVTDDAFGRAEVWIDGKLAKVLVSNTGSWGQSVVDLVWDEEEAAEHTVEIRMAAGDEAKKFTVTCMAYTPGE